MITILFSTVAMMLVYMMLGFILRKSGKTKVAHAKSFSGLLIYVLGPAMIINSFLKLEYTNDNLIKIGQYFAVTLFIQIIFFIILYVFLNKKYADSKYRIMTVGSVLGNVGYLGMPVIQSIFPEYPIVSCYSSINVISMNLIVFTMGVFMITGDKKYISVKSAVINPTTLSLLVAFPIFILKISFGQYIESAVDLLAKMVTPMCMIILGMRLSEANLKNIFTRLFVYETCFLKLIVFPVFAMFIVKWIPFLDNTFKTTVIVLAMAPAGAIIESLAELHECEQEFAANVVLLTTLLSVITIPLMTYLLINLAL